jgi:hypothetical protein
MALARGSSLEEIYKMVRTQMDAPADGNEHSPRSPQAQDRRISHDQHH